MSRTPVPPRSAALSGLVRTRHDVLDAVRGVALLWMTLYHFAFDLNYFGFIQQDFYRSPVWTLQRTCILSLFLFCAGGGQAIAVSGAQGWPQFWRRWAQIAGCALLVSAGSALVFPRSWIYFGVLHGMAVMLPIARLTAGWGRGLWLAGLAAVAAGVLAPQAHAQWPQFAVLDGPALNWMGLVGRKPVTEDFVPLLPWLGAVWWGVAAGQWVMARGWLRAGAPVRSRSRGIAALALIGRSSLSWYMLHQLLLMGVLTLAATALR